METWPFVWIDDDFGTKGAHARSPKVPMENQWNDEAMAEAVQYV